MSEVALRAVERAVIEKITNTNPPAIARSAARVKWRQQILLITASAALCTTLSVGSAAAQGWTGAISNDWTNSANWNSGLPTSAGTAMINTSSANPTVLGVSGPAIGT